MLPGRLKDAPKAAARASHAIRSRTSEENWLEINSTNLDELVAQPLPDPTEQLRRLVGHFKNRAGDGYLSEVLIGDLSELESVVGAVDVQALTALIKWAAEDGWLKIIGNKRVQLTAKAWPAERLQLTPTQPPDVPTEGKVKTVKGHCPECGSERNGHVMAEHGETTDIDKEGGIWASDTYRILRCGGCDTLYVQFVHTFSEDVEIIPGGGWLPVPHTAYWPAPARRKKPAWLDEIQDPLLQSLLQEVYGALDADHRVLAAIGTRTALDRAMVLLNASESSNFPRKLDELVANGVLGADEKASLLILTDAGSASAHRAWTPSPETLDTIMAGAETFLHRTMILPAALGAVRNEIPPRQKGANTSRPSASG
jgi:hypothetical protein